MASYQTGEAPIILPEMWGQTVRLNHDSSDVVTASGNVTLFAFNFTPDGRPDASTFHPPQSGNVRLQFKLNGSAGHAITVLILLNLRMSWKSIITTVCCTTTTVEEGNSLRQAINNSVIWGTTIPIWPRISRGCSRAIVFPHDPSKMDLVAISSI